MTHYAAYQDALAKALALSRLDDERQRESSLLSRHHSSDHHPNNASSSSLPSSQRDRWGERRQYRSFRDKPRADLQADGIPPDDPYQQPLQQQQQQQPQHLDVSFWMTTTNSGSRTNRRANHSPLRPSSGEGRMPTETTADDHHNHHEYPSSFILDTDSRIGEDLHCHSNHSTKQDDADDDFNDGGSMASTVTGSFFTYRTGASTLANSTIASNASANYDRIPKECSIIPEHAPRGTRPQPNPRRERSLPSLGPLSPPCRQQSLSSRTQDYEEDLGQPVPSLYPRQTDVVSHADHEELFLDQYRQYPRQNPPHSPQKSGNSYGASDGRSSNGTNHSIKDWKSNPSSLGQQGRSPSYPMYRQHSKISGRSGYNHHPGFDHDENSDHQYRYQPDYVVPPSRPGAVRVDGPRNAAMPPRAPQRQGSVSSACSVHPAPTGRPALIEISPGVNIPLREIDETLAAVANDHYVPVTCGGCSVDLFCIADASYALCPECHSFTPLQGGTVSIRDRHGLGLGFTVENLFRMQSDILESRRGAGETASRTSSRSTATRVG